MVSIDWIVDELQRIYALAPAYQVTRRDDAVVVTRLGVVYKEFDCSTPEKIDEAWNAVRLDSSPVIQLFR